jgi:hypothetical protein
MDDIFKLCIAVLITIGVVTSIFFAAKSAKYDEVNDPNRTHYITRTDENLQHGEIYEMEHTPAHREQRTCTEMQAGFWYGINPATGQFSYHYGFFPTTIFFYVDVPEKYALRIVRVDTERLIYFVNEITVSDSIYKGYSVGEFFGEVEI